MKLVEDVSKMLILKDAIAHRVRLADELFEPDMSRLDFRVGDGCLTGVLGS